VDFLWCKEHNTNTVPAVSCLEDLETRRSTSLFKYIRKLWAAERTHPEKPRIVKPGIFITDNSQKKRNQKKIFLKKSLNSALNLITV